MELLKSTEHKKASPTTESLKKRTELFVEASTKLYEMALELEFDNPAEAKKLWKALNTCGVEDLLVIIKLLNNH